MLFSYLSKQRGHARLDVAVIDGNLEVALLHDETGEVGVIALGVVRLLLRVAASALAGVRVLGRDRVGDVRLHATLPRHVRRRLAAFTQARDASGR